jgi:flavin-dependent dehydrogenase
MFVQSQEDFEYITKESSFSGWFPDVKIAHVKCFVGSIWSPVSEPYRNNVMLVGDSAWSVEAENTGSMMCGKKAANAVTIALRDNKPNREGVLNFIEWWQKSYPEFDDYRNFLLGLAFSLIFSEEETNYLYSLFKSPLRSTLNPFLMVRRVKKASEPMLFQIEKEMPAVAEKLKMLEIDNAENIFFNILSKMAQ